MNRTRSQPCFQYIIAVFAIGLALASLFAVGCSSNQNPTGKVSGKVTYQGQPVTGGSVTFVPIGSGSGTAGNANAGKPASGNVESDGTYKLTTYTKDDGAVIGKARVSYSAPTPQLPEGKTLKSGETMPKSPFDGLQPKVAEVEVKSGNNPIDIELVAPTGAAPAGK